jgi:hypothetical protein
MKKNVVAPKDSEVTDIAQFDQLTADITKLVAPAKAIAIADAAGQAHAVGMGKSIKDILKRIDEKRKELVQPIKARASAIDAFAKQISAPLLEAEAHLKRQIGAFEDQERARRELELKRIREEQEAADRRKAELVAKATEGVTDETAKLMTAVKVDAEFKEVRKDLRQEEKAVETSAMKGAKLVWKFEVTNGTEVPREYMVIDEKKIREAVFAGAREIPGVRIYQETQISFGKTTAVSVAAQRDSFFGGAQ